MSEEVLARVLEILERLRIPSMIVGSFASNYYGEPRSTHGADIVIQIAVGDALDWEYLTTWADRLSVRAILDTLQADRLDRDTLLRSIQ